MSDINRVPIPYGSQQVSNKPKNVTKRTIRIAVKLPQSNEDTCPEYNYKDELDAAKKRGSTKNTENGGMLDMFGDDDGDVRRIAMQMEEKYGKGVAVSKKRRRGRKDDYADIGMGYDESDSFIDNTDGYDEIIPQNVDTLHGGFYINCGALEFKTDDEDSMESSSCSSESGSGSPKNGKRSFESDNSDDEAKGTQQSKKSKLDTTANGMKQALKKKLFSPNKILKKKRPSNVLKKTVKDLLTEKRKDLNMSVRQGSDIDLQIPVLTEGEKNVENGKKLSSSITDAIESVVKASDEPILGGDRLSSQGTEEVKPIQLPENLPNNISEVIGKIKQAAVTLSGSNKFTDEINSLLLSMERKCKCLGKPSKTKVYEYLSFFINVEKQVLIQHCNQLALKDEEKKIKSILQKLKAEIDKVMPSIIGNYEKECELVLEKRTLLQQQNQEGEEKRKSIGRPRRKFQWNDQTKKYLKDTATIKKRSYLLQGNSKEAWEEELSLFLKNNILHLWPEGWMTMTTLTKVCNKLFNDPKTANTSSSATKKENKNTAPNTPILAYPNVSITPVASSAQSKVSSKTNANEKTLDINKVEKSSKDQVHKEHPHKEYSHKEHSHKEYSHKEHSHKEHSHKERSHKEHSHKEHTYKDNAQKENPQKEHILKERPKEKVEIMDVCSDKTNNNGNMFFKVEYDKPHCAPSSFKPKDFIQEVKETGKFPNVNVIELESPNNFSNLLPKTKLKSKNDFEFSSSSNTVLKNVSESNNRNKERTLIINEVEKPKDVNNTLEENHRILSDGDDIQKVMEHLKTLQKMSSPVKTFEGSSSSNTGFSQKSPSVLKNNIDLVTSSFQDEFQKQLFSALGNLAPNSSKSNYKCS